MSLATCNTEEADTQWLLLYSYGAGRSDQLRCVIPCTTACPPALAEQLQLLHVLPTGAIMWRVRIGLCLQHSSGVNAQHALRPGQYGTAPDRQRQENTEEHTASHAIPSGVLSDADSRIENLKDQPKIPVRIG
ncbi:hypothetical protein E2C01_015275 [Portunus trituberculatus]|uniref:Uncharacterized protein n=1 Tax=Portunus trituberculatus TaxID=210409 RepID=A0A5B7DM52_PORTR|nr:hypothetical protein [Portunus trituberculatus]